MDGHTRRQTERAELCGSGREVPYGPTDRKAVRTVIAESGVHINRGPKPTKMETYKQIVDEWLEKAPYSALRILEKLWEMEFDGCYSIVKAIHEQLENGSERESNGVI